MGEGLGPAEKKKKIFSGDTSASALDVVVSGGGRDAGVSERVGGVTHRPRGALDGPDPVEDVISVREGADARVRLRLRVGGKGERRGFNNRAENLKENARGGGGARKARSARLGDAETRGFPPSTRETRRARAIRTMRDISSLCSLRRGEERKGMPSLSEWGKNPSRHASVGSSCVASRALRASTRTSWRPTRCRKPHFLHPRPSRLLAGPQSPLWRWCSCALARPVHGRCSKFRNRPGFRRLATRDPERRDDEGCLARSRASDSHESSDRGVRAIRASREVGRPPRSPPGTRKKARPFPQNICARVSEISSWKTPACQLSGSFPGVAVDELPISWFANPRFALDKNFSHSIRWGSVNRFYFSREGIKVEAAKRVQAGGIQKCGQRIIILTED